MTITAHLAFWLPPRPRELRDADARRVVSEDGGDAHVAGVSRYLLPGWTFDSKKPCLVR